MALHTMQQQTFGVSGTAVVLLSQFSLTDKQNDEIAGCDLSIQTANVYLRMDGGALSTSGMLLKNGGIYRVTGRTDVLNARLIRVSSNACVVAGLLRGE